MDESYGSWYYIIRNRAEFAFKLTLMMIIYLQDERKRERVREREVELLGKRRVI